jgi:arylsulfatase A-like enzyme
MKRPVRSVLAALVAAATAAAGLQAAVSAPAEAKPTKPDKVVIILVDSLSKEIVKKYDMPNIRAMMRGGVASPKSYLGHLGAVTVVTHNVVTSGQLPKHMGWTDEGYRDVDGVLSGLGLGDDDSDLWITSNWGFEEMFAVQNAAGYPKLADYLHAARPDSKVFTISPKTYAAWAMGGDGSDSIVTFGSSTTCPGLPGSWRAVSEDINPPDYIAEVCGRWYVPTGSDLRYDTMENPASLYPLDGDRYTNGKNPDHQGGDVWAADAAIKIMQEEKDDWSGIFVSLPGVDKSAHMWGGVDDDGGTDPMTHMENATKVADEQVGKILDELRTSGELDSTLVVLTSDHGSVAGRNFFGDYEPDANYGFFNWYYGDVENDAYLDPQEALKPLVATENVGLSYSDSMLRAWLKNQSKVKKREAAKVVATLPRVTSVWIRDGDHYNRIGKVRWGRMTEPREKLWYQKHARELINTEAAAYGPDVIATLPDHTTYSVAGDHGGIQRAAQDIPIVFAGAGVSNRDLQAPIRSVDIMPTVLRHLGIPETHPMDGIGYALPKR